MPPSKMGGTPKGKPGGNGSCLNDMRRVKTCPFVGRGKNIEQLHTNTLWGAGGGRGRVRQNEPEGGNIMDKRKKT